jgi:hypothetical protein
MSRLSTQETMVLALLVLKLYLFITARIVTSKLLLALEGPSTFYG